MHRPAALRRALVVALVGGVAGLVLVLGTGRADEPALERASVSSAGVEANGGSSTAAVSDDGRYVGFSSDASNLVPGDTNARDVFVRDRATGSTELVSVASNGTQANAPALWPAISGDGRYVAFASDADNLVPGDMNGESDVFVHDRIAGTTERVSVDGTGVEGNDESATPSISGDGRHVAFTSLASNLAPGDTNGDRDVFLHDRTTGMTELISVASDGTPGDTASGGFGAGPGRVSADGRYVVFGSFATNLVPDDTNGVDDIFVRDRTLGTTERVSIASDGTQGASHSMYGDISGDGRYVVFFSSAEELAPDDAHPGADVLLHDRAAGTTSLLSRGNGAAANGASRFPAITADGRFVAYQSDASNLVSGDGNASTDIFLQDIATGAIERVGAGDDDSRFPAIDASGRTIGFESHAADLTDGDTNGVSDIFAWGKPIAQPATATPTRTATPTATPMPRFGDADCSGAVSSVDAALILQRSAQIVRILPCPIEADANMDGAVNAVDATLVLQLVAGLLEGLPP